MKKLVLVPNNMKSRGIKALAATLSQKLGYRVFRVAANKIRKRVGFKINAGTDKLTQMQKFEQSSVTSPPYTQDRAVAAQWIGEGHTIMCRTLLRASEGRGIVVAERVDQLVPAALYTKYVPKKEEYRVHVLNGQVIDIQQKRKRKGFEDERNTKIRNLTNGYVFCRDGIVEPSSIRDLAVQAVTSLGYHLGAVDIAYNVKNNLLVVLEVNANPGMQGTTLENYANQIIAQLKNGSINSN